MTPPGWRHPLTNSLSTFLLPRKLHDAISLRLRSGPKCSVDPLTISRRCSRAQPQPQPSLRPLFLRTRACIAG